MYVSHETTEQTSARLRRVMQQAHIIWMQGQHEFAEFPVDRFPAQEAGQALAFVRDAQVWSVLRPAGTAPREPFGIFSVHFPAGADNSGFVGWLASTFKERLGTGVFVVCGQNSEDGGIFDYWGVPWELCDAARALVAELAQ